MAFVAVADFTKALVADLATMFVPVVVAKRFVPVFFLAAPPDTTTGGLEVETTPLAVVVVAF
jgi:hypothetical protein